MKVHEKAISIIDLPKADRPRERLAQMGSAALSDRELLSIIIGSGVKGQGVHQVAEELLRLIDRTGPNPEPESIQAISGIGLAKASLISAALEFSRRRFVPGKRKISNPSDILPLVRHLADRPQEQFISISLNGAHEVIKLRIVSVGLVNKTLVHPREVFVGALTDRAAAIICSHNHPSGTLQPSMEDHEVTQRVRRSGEILGVPLLDHIIFTGEGYYSFLEEGELSA